MKTQKLNSNFLIGAGLMIIPALFFFSVAMEQLFHNNFLVENIFVRIDKFSDLLSAFLMVGLPFIAICINILPLINFNTERLEKSFRISIEIKANILNIAIILLGMLTIMTIIAYLFTENF